MNENLININTKEAEKKLSVIQKHFTTILILVFGFVIAFLFRTMMNTQSELIQYMKSDAINNAKVIDNNTQLLREIKEKLEQIADQNKHYPND
jgi:F0F1-type ATP synthase alpha subunit